MPISIAPFSHTELVILIQYTYTYVHTFHTKDPISLESRSNNFLRKIFLSPDSEIDRIKFSRRNAARCKFTTVVEISLSLSALNLIFFSYLFLSLQVFASFSFILFSNAPASDGVSHAEKIERRKSNLREK